MSKQPDSIMLSVNGLQIRCDRVEHNYYAGDFAVVSDGDSSEVNLHVEVIPAVEDKQGDAEAKDCAFDNRLEAWYLVNHEGEQPTLMTIPGLGKCFIHMEVFAK
jgi:hypothetical protein